jgi:hypothetical protein
MSAVSRAAFGMPPPGGARFITPGIIYAIQHIRNVRGGSQAKLMWASDGYWYVTKFQDNPQGLKVLANEMLASSIARYLKLPVPHTEIIEVDDWLIEHTPDLRVQCDGHSRPFTSGLQLGSRYVAGDAQTPVFDYLPESFAEKIVNLSDFGRCLAFDKWLGNSDGRQAVFTRKKTSPKWQAIFIDHGYCFNAGEWTFPDLALQGVYYRNWVYQNVTGWKSFEPALSLAEEIDPNELWQYATQVPAEWYSSKRSDLCQLIDTLYGRRRQIRDLITKFRDSSRNPFPNWT